jgi:hypothetical protein
MNLDVGEANGDVELPAGGVSMVVCFIFFVFLSGCLAELPDPLLSLSVLVKNTGLKSGSTVKGVGMLCDAAKQFNQYFVISSECNVYRKELVLLSHL